MKKYAILCGSRTGSTYLCDLLTATNRCGRPKEFFNTSLDFKQDKHSIIRRYKTENEVFGTKVVGFKQLDAYLASGIETTHWIYLYREDSTLQAISRYIAYDTNGWHKDRELPPYSYSDIEWCLEEVKAENEFYASFFADKEHLKLVYETDICENPEQSVMCVLQYLDISTDELPKIRTKDYSPRNLKWKEQFEKEYRSKK